MDKPQEIGRFAVLAIAACLINAASALFLINLSGPQRIATPIVALILIAVILAVVFVRSSIARLLFTVWLVYGFGRALMSYGRILFGGEHAAQPLTIVASLIAILLNLGALFFLWSRVASQWLQKTADAS